MQPSKNIPTNDKEVLEHFVINNPELERLESLLDQFNIFEAIGAVRQELRHSDFLAFLQNPQQNHGLGETFLKSFLQKVLIASRGADLPISLIDLDVWSLEDSDVLREWHSIDILIVNETNKLVVLVENKIGTQEHSDQLNRYYETVAKHYPSWKTVALFLTPDGYPPSDDRYLPVSYGTIAGLLDELIERRSSTLGVDVKALVCHYAQMLRRHIVSDSEIAELCRKIYRKHQRALDLIFESRPNFQDEVINIIEGLVQEYDGFVVDKHTPSWISFVPIEWDDLIGQNPSPMQGNWSIDRRFLLFWVERTPAKVRLILEILPGPAEMRQQIFDIAQAHKPPFSIGFKKLYPSYCRIWSRLLLGKDWQEKYSVEELEERLREQWCQFMVYDLPLIKQFISNGVSK